MSRRGSSLIVAAILLSAVSSAQQVHAGSKSEITRQIRFGTEMAKEGNWREAIFRWQRALALDPANARVHNNLAVAYESLGEYAKADAEYLAALAGPDVPSEIQHNYDLFKNFYARYKEIVVSPDSETLGESKRQLEKAP